MVVCIRRARGCEYIVVSMRTYADDGRSNISRTDADAAAQGADDGTTRRCAVVGDGRERPQHDTGSGALHRECPAPSSCHIRIEKQGVPDRQRRKL